MLTLFFVGTFLFSVALTDLSARDVVSASDGVLTGVGVSGGEGTSEGYWARRRELDKQIVVNSVPAGEAVRAPQKDVKNRKGHAESIKAAVAARAPQSAGLVTLLEIKGVINPVVSEYISRELKASQADVPVLIQLNTPGGLMESMNEIVMSILNAPAPVIVWVGPAGAKAVSAGVFITMASDIAAMAPATNIGAAHPVQIGRVPIPSQPPDGEQNKKEQKKQADENKGER